MIVLYGESLRCRQRAELVSPHRAAAAVGTGTGENFRQVHCHNSRVVRGFIHRVFTEAAVRDFSVDDAATETRTTTTTTTRATTTRVSVGMSVCFNGVLHDTLGQQRFSKVDLPTAAVDKCVRLCCARLCVSQ